ncbi:hypothetical protein V6N13_014848 [Hibiscus sabdariffa]
MHTDICGVIDSHTEVLERTRVKGRGKKQAKAETKKQARNIEWISFIITRFGCLFAIAMEKSWETFQDRHGYL